MIKRRSFAYIFSIAVSCIVLLVFIAFFTGDKDGIEKRNQVYHKLLEQPSTYKGAPFIDAFNASAGIYTFDFVASGDSPKALLISVSGNSLTYHGDFRLNGTLHDSGFSKYYTWEYTTNDSDNFSLESDQILQIKIRTESQYEKAQTPSAPVSIYILKDRA